MDEPVSELPHIKLGGRIAATVRAQAQAAARALAATVMPARAANAFVADCLQCGRDRVDIVRLGRGRARVSCRACGAVTVQDRSRLRSPPKRSRPDTTPGESRPAQQAHPLAPYVPAELLAWACKAGRDRQITTLDKAAIYRLWKEFDRLCGRVDGFSLPPIGEVVSLLHASCYDESVVAAELTGREAELGDAAAIAERVRCARRWLAGPGREHCWIERTVRDHNDKAVVRALLEEGALHGPLDGAQRAALYAAAFGTTGGPTPAVILRRFDASTIEQALQTHLVDGSHPLRETVLAALDGHEPPDRPVDQGHTRC
jgi:hypothetical protein